MLSSASSRRGFELADEPFDAARQSYETRFRLVEGTGPVDQSKAANPLVYKPEGDRVRQQSSKIRFRSAKRWRSVSAVRKNLTGADETRGLLRTNQLARPSLAIDKARGVARVLRVVARGVDPRHAR